MLVHPHQKSLYQFEGNFHAYLHAKKSTPVYLETFQINSKFVFSAIWACLVKHNDTKDLKNLSSGKKSILSFGFSLRYCKGIANLLFRIPWEWQATHTNL